MLTRLRKRKLSDAMQFPNKKRKVHIEEDSGSGSVTGSEEGSGSGSGSDSEEEFELASDTEDTNPFVSAIMNKLANLDLDYPLLNNILKKESKEHRSYNYKPLFKKLRDLKKGKCDIYLSDILSLKIDDTTMFTLISRFTEIQSLGSKNPIRKNYLIESLNKDVLFYKNSAVADVLSFNVTPNDITSLKCIPPYKKRELLKKLIYINNIESPIKFILQDTLKQQIKVYKELNGNNTPVDYSIESIAKLNMHDNDKLKAIDLYVNYSDTIDESIKQHAFNKLDSFVRTNTIGTSISTKDFIGLEKRLENKYNFCSTNLKYKILSLSKKGVPEDIIYTLYKQYKHLLSLNTDSDDFNIKKHQLELQLKLPLENTSKPKLGSSKKHKHYLKNISLAFQKSIYKNFKPKSRILEFICNELTGNKNGNMKLLLVGKPGTGKTKICKCVGKAIGRPVIKISGGSLFDITRLKGNRACWLGSNIGIIASKISEFGTKKIIIIVDEFDKVPSGKIANFWMDILDNEQNTEFIDDHIPEIPIDLSQVIFFFTANDISGIPSPLLDRLDIIRFDDHTFDDKLTIIRDYKLPEAIDASPFDKDDIVYDSNSVRYLINKLSNFGFNSIRNINDHIDTILRRLNFINTTHGLSIPSCKSFYIKDLSFPCYLGKELLDKILCDLVHNSSSAGNVINSIYS